jgi:DNA-binding LacI/PurR family transcriptional regulator
MATLMDIAKLANVSKATVSKVLSDSSEISAGTKKRVLKIVSDLGYVPNQTAQILAGKKSRTIGLVINEIDANYYNDVVGVIERNLNAKDYSLLIAITGFEVDNQINYIKLFLQKRVDGLVIKPTSGADFSKKFKELQKSINIPVVLLGKPISGVNVNVIESDDYLAMDQAIAHLIELGHKKIFFICDKISRSRKSQFLNILGEKNLLTEKNHVKEGTERFQIGGYLRMQELILEQKKDFAVIAHYDSMANGALKAIYEHSLSVPGDISLIGFDNILESAYYQVPLTTIDFPNSEIGTMATDIIFDEIENGEAISKKNITLKPNLIIRNSTGPAKY